MAKTIYSMHCPRDNKLYTSDVSRADVLEIVKKHVSEQHPDHDPDWWDTHTTHPTTEEN